MPRGQIVLVRIDPKAATARLDVSLGADVAAKYFADGARIRVTAEGQPAEFATERQIAVRLAGIDANLLQLQCDASDFTRIEFGPIDVPQDRRIELTAEITSESTAVAASEYATSARRSSSTGRRRQSANSKPTEFRPVPFQWLERRIQTEIVLRCRADDGEGSGVSQSRICRRL